MLDLDDLLIKTSRTFGVSIPLLPEPLRREVTIAYLLFRIADTFEDATGWPAPVKLAALDDFAALLTAAPSDAAGQLARSWIARPPIDHAGYTELLEQTPFVLEQLRALDPLAQAPIVKHTLRTVDGMKGFVNRTSSAGELRLTDTEDLRDYCYAVAGIVGEMLTDLFVLRCPALRAQGSALQAEARFFGEGLQLVNILKDSASDAGQGRLYLPPSVSLGSVFALARASLDEAVGYILAIQAGSPPPGVLRFLTLPLFLAWSTLDCVEERGSGAKLTRPMVLGCLGRVQAAYAPGDPVLTRETIGDLYRSAMGVA